MAVKKEGELRIRKGKSIYGPMSRHDLDRLLASGRVSLTDFVSVLGGPWTEILQFVSPPAAVEQQRYLRVLRGDRIFGAIDLRRLKQLCAEGRIDGDDLVCTIGGPWMTVADFLAPPRPPIEMAEEVEEIYEAEPLEPAVEYVPLKWYHVYAEEVDEKKTDQWYMLINGIHSAPLTRRQVRRLFLAREITGQNVARHVTSDEDSWRPIDSIPELADMLRTEDAS